VSQPKITVFDLDKTITTKDTFVPFLLGLVLRNPWTIFFGFHLLNKTWLFYRKKITNHELKEYFLLKILKPSRQKSVKKWCGLYSQTVVKKYIYQDARSVIDEKLSCSRVILVTASIECYVTPVAQALGIKEVICTKLERSKTGRYTGKIDGENCYGEEKVKRLKLYLGDLPGESLIEAYSDHHSDFPLLNYSDHGYLINPSIQLSKHIKNTSIRTLHWH
jgi:phosphatidylglycerophosphatase C